MKIYSNFWYHFWKTFLKPYMHLYLNLRYKQKVPFPDGPKIFAVNHPTVWDAFPILVYGKGTYVSVMVEEQIWSFRLPRFIFATANQIKLFNLDKSKTEDSINDALQILSMGRSILISPEGGRTDPAEMVRGKKGTIRLATDAKAPIIPIGVWISPEGIKYKKIKYYYRGEKYHDIAPIPKFRANYGVVYGEPFYIEEFLKTNSSLENYQFVADELLRRIYLLSSEAKELFS